MSPGRRRSAADGAPARDRVFIEPAERRGGDARHHRAAPRERLVLSLFRCNDFGILDALAAALERGVKVEAILTKRAKGGKKRLRKLWDALEEMGARRALVRRSGREVSRQVPGRRRRVGAGRDAQSDQEVLHAHVGLRADSRTDRRWCDRCATLFALDAAGRARAAAPSHQPAPDRRARGRARAHARADRRRAAQHPHPRSQAVGSRSRRAAARAARRGHRGVGDRPAADRPAACRTAS